MYKYFIIFSYNFQNKMKGIGAVWCGIALTAVTYFALFKGLKNAPVMPVDLMSYINENILLCVVAAFLFWTMVMVFLAFLKVITPVKEINQPLGIKYFTPSALPE